MTGKDFYRSNRNKILCGYVAVLQNNMQAWIKH